MLLGGRRGTPMTKEPREVVRNSDWGPECSNARRNVTLEQPLAGGVHQTAVESIQSQAKVGAMSTEVWVWRGCRSASGCRTSHIFERTPGASETVSRQAGCHGEHQRNARCDAECLVPPQCSDACSLAAPQAQEHAMLLVLGGAHWGGWCTFPPPSLREQTPQTDPNRSRPELAFNRPHSGANSAEFCRPKCGRADRRRARICRNRQALVELGPNFPKLGRMWSTSFEAGPTSDQTCPAQAKLVPRWAKPVPIYKVNFDVGLFWGIYERLGRFWPLRRRSTFGRGGTGPFGFLLDSRHGCLMCCSCGDVRRVGRC